MMRGRLSGLAVTVVLVVGGPWSLIAATAEDPASSGHVDERQRRVVAFVDSHQPELAELLVHLRVSKPAEYARAIEELDRSVQPLITGKAKDPRLYEIELRAWQARTRVDVLGAHWIAAKGGDAKERETLERQLREAIAVEFDMRAAQLAYRKERSIAWYDRQLNRLSTKRDDLIAARLKAIVD
jgi:hypothetical protein